jgi:two-component system OmpR family sensor kinase
MSGFRSLYTRLAVGLVLLLFVIGVLYTALNAIATQRFVAQLNQDLNRTLAQNLVADKNLVEQGKLNEAALKETFQQYMMVNPSIEIYLLDLEGNLLSYSADSRSVLRNRVSLEPIKAFLSGTEKYPMGDDPRSHDKKKAFSVTEVPSGIAPEGYLYVVLRGEQYDALESMAYQGFWARAGLWSMVLSLILGLLAGLAIFYWLTKRLSRVSRRIEQFSDSDFKHWSSVGSVDSGVDEIAQIERIFERMAARIQNQLAALTDKDNQRRQLVAQVSHDLRTPLASMLGYIESLKLRRDTLSSKEQDEFLEIAYTQGRRLSHMIDSLFQLSSLEAKEIQPQLEPFVPLEILFDIRQKYAIRFEQANLSLQVDSAQSSAFAMGDISLFERVLDNLIDNAMVHAESASTVTLRVENQAQSIAILVINRGEPIEDDELNFVFDPFYRVSSQTADRRHAGLGLAISRRIMESLDGTISVKNTSQGVTFTVCLPTA